MGGGGHQKPYIKWQEGKWTVRKCIKGQEKGKLCDYCFSFFLNGSSTINNTTVSNRTRSQALTACQVARVPQRNSETKEDPGEVVHVNVLLRNGLISIPWLWFTVPPLLCSCSFFIINNNRCIQHPRLSLPERVPHVSQVDQQCGAGVPLQAVRGQCICDRKSAV